MTQPVTSQDKVSFMIDDRELTVAKGTTVMEAASKAGIYIPHFCWHPGLPIAGVCRFCMVKVEGRPKLEIACNLTATPGMKVSTLDPTVKDAHKWALEFHLVNHPLDCPICDQAGECKLQDYYMEVGKYKSQMDRPKVLKPKALDVGDDLVLDTERCILCDRCVRFEEQVTKTGALGIFNRGDRAVVGTYPGKEIHHNYQTNLVDICPVGAFTSKDFRFKQRVWFLKDKPSVCPGCSTGCHIDVFAKPEVRTYFRVKPRASDVNGHWMCDAGRHTYKHLNQEARLRTAWVPEAGAAGAPGRKKAGALEAIADLAARLSSVESAAKDVALLVSAQFTTEEYDALFAYFVGKLGVTKVYPWREATEKLDEFDGILYRGDHNPNTAGLAAAMKRHGLKADATKSGFDELAKGGNQIVIALAPEVSFQFPSLADHGRRLAELPFVSIWSVTAVPVEAGQLRHALPLKGFAEKTGSFLNFAGKKGELAAPFPAAVEGARDVTEIVAALAEAQAHAGRRDGGM